jgi:hypothetical protein
LRESVLSEAAHATVADTADFARRLEGLRAGARLLLRGALRAPVATSAMERAANAGRGTLFWHPLASDASGFSALVVRTAEPVGLADYLGRDHAVIEAALAGALRGDLEALAWLRASLARHLAIEEQCLFPAYVKAGGREAWVRGLENEHRYLRRYLERLDEDDGRRKFLRLLDGHDEKEERVVYPDLLAHLGPRATALLPQVIVFPIPESVINETSTSDATA